MFFALITPPHLEFCSYNPFAAFPFNRVQRVRISFSA